MTMDVRIGIRMTPKCARFRAPQEWPALDTAVSILMRTRSNCANIRITRSNYKNPQAAQKMTQKIFHYP